MIFPKQNSLLWCLIYGPKYLPFWPKKTPKFIHKSWGCTSSFSCCFNLSSLLLLIEWHPKSVMMEIPDSWVLWGAWLQEWETPQTARLSRPPRNWIQYLFSLSLPSCSYSQVLDIFQINIKRWFEKQTFSAPSKRKGNMHLNENLVFY